MKRKFYFSGHSLTNPRMVGFLSEIARAADIDLAWDQQHLVGSSIRQRRQGYALDPQAPAYRHGVDRAGRPADLLGAFAARGEDGRAIDTLVVTEQHAVLNALVWQETVSSLRHIHEAFIRANPGSRTIFFEPWLSIDDKAAPQRWIEYEQAAEPVWKCAVSSVNQSLAVAGHTDRIVSMPMGMGLAFLASLASRPESKGDLAGGSTRDRMNLFFDDDVHLTEAGDFYAAAVMFLHLFGATRQINWSPAAVGEPLAQFVKKAAADAVAKYPMSEKTNNLADCRRYIDNKFFKIFIEYYHDANLRKSSNFISSLYQKFNIKRSLKAFYNEKSPSNPLVNNPVTSLDHKQ
jgi:hypothetical protein